MTLDPGSPEIHSWLQLAHMIRRSEAQSHRVRDALVTANQLIRHGCYDPALRFIGMLEAANLRDEAFQVRLAKLAATAEQVRRIPALESPFANPVQTENLLSFRSVFLNRNAAPRSLIVVYATAYNNFDISFPFLHQLIASRADGVLYVKNPALGMYATGNHEFGRSIDAMSAELARIIARMSPAKVMVLGFSSGGYAALHMAATVGADRFVGFSIKTDWSADSPLPNVSKLVIPTASERSRNTLINLRSLEAISRIAKATLFFGDTHAADREHALNMNDLENFVMRPIERGSHNAIMDLLERGQLSAALDEGLC